ncbi:MAG: hypothetical protein HYZ36_04070, partial [Pedosphaera parvula]|nr:hypothetical protein [Pedosphaera parvula]
MLNLLPDSAPAVQALRFYQEQFANAGELMITVQSTAAETTAPAAQALAERLRRETGLVTRATWQPPWVEHPGQSAELVAFRWLHQPPERVRALLHRLAPANLPGLLSDTREQLATSLSPAELVRLSYDPLQLLRVPGSDSGDWLAGRGAELFESRDGTFRIIYLQPGEPLLNYRACVRWLNQVQAIVNHWRAQTAATSDLVVRYTGRPAFVAEIAAGMERDINRGLGGTLCIILLLFWLA